MTDDINKKISIGVEVSPDGQQQISQYKAAFDNLRVSISNLANPLNGLSGSISSLDKDLSKLTGSIDKLNKQNQETNSTGNKVKATVTDVITSFVTWEDIIKKLKLGVAGLEAELSAGLSLIVAFLPEIVDWVSALFKGNTTLTALNKTLKDNKIVTDAVNDARLKGTQDAQQELVHLKLLYKASQDHNVSLKDRKKIVGELKSQYPTYFGGLSDEAILAGKAAKSYAELAKSILATSRARAAEELIVTNSKRQLGNEQKIAALKVELDKKDAAIKKAEEEHKHNLSAVADVVRQSEVEFTDPEGQGKISGLAEERAALKKTFDDLNTDSKLLTRQNEALAKTVIGDTEKNGARTLGVVQDVGKQLTSIGHKAKSIQHTIQKEAKKKAADLPATPPPVKEDTNESFQREEAIDPGSTPGAGTDHSLAQQPAGGFKTDLLQQYENKAVEIKKTALQQVEDYAKQKADKMASYALTTLSENIKKQAEAKVAALEKDKAAELSNSSLTSAQKLAIEEKYKKREAAVKAKAFKEEQKASIAQAIINGAIAVTKAEAQTGVLGPLVIPGIIAETAVQVAKIASQKQPAYARGGLHYQSDGRGGILPGYSRADNTNAYLRSGEGIIVSEAMQVPWARNLVSAINVGFGGRDFSMANPGRGYAVGGIFTDGGDANRYYNQPVTDQKNLANTIAYQMINNFPPVYVDVKDVNNQQNILAQTINRVNL